MLQKLQKIMKEKQLDGFFIGSIHNLRYLSGYTSADAYLFITASKNYFITDPRYTEQAEQECPNYEIVNWRNEGKPLFHTIARLARENGVKRLAFEADQLTYLNYAGLLEAMKEANISLELVPLTGVVEAFRAVKTDEEVDLQRKACDISCRALKRLMNDIRPGVVEKELATLLSYYMVQEGADTKPYGDIVITGKKTSLLHGIPSEKKIEPGDFVLIDFGCAYQGYLSDMTRTFVVGKATEEQKKIYRLEQQMVEDSLNAIIAGATCRSVYEASIKCILDTDYFPYHYNNIGHSIGRFVHELPYLSPHSDDTLLENMVTTVEPGLYIPNWGGVRIEDQVVVTKTGCEILTPFPKELIELS